MSDEDKSKPSGPVHKGPLSELEGLNSRDLALAVQKLNPGQKKLLALKGNAAIRRILLRDPNVDIQLAVVSGQKSSESDIAQIASLASTAEIVLKSISDNPRWAKSYRIKLCLASNPKTPVSIATRCLRALATHDLKKIAKDPHQRKLITQAAEQLLKSRK